MQFVTNPAQSMQGTITVPGDKSISHRSLLLGAIANGTTQVKGFLDGEDCMSTLHALTAMGVDIEGPIHQEILIHGVGKYGLKQPRGVLNCGNSGTTMRLMAGLLAPQEFSTQLSGDESLMKRPMLRISNPLNEMGAAVSTWDGRPPISIQGGRRLVGIDYVMPQASAQVKSCLLLAGMYAEGQTRITETGISRDHTERMLRTLSYPLIQQDNTLIIDSKSECQGTEMTIPGDISSAAFFIVAASIIPGSDILIRNVGINPTRTGILEILNQMGANIRITNIHFYGEEPVADIAVSYSQLNGIDIPRSMVPLAIDEFPILFIAAAAAKGVTTLQGASELRFKESDRIGVMVEGLNQLGVEAEGLEDGIRIMGSTLKGGTVDSKGDHRIAMSFAIAGAVSSESITIKNCACVATSFPSFVPTANSLHLRIEEVKNDVG